MQEGASADAPSSSEASKTWKPLERVANAEAELIGIRRSAELELFAVAGLFHLVVAQAHKAVGQVGREVVCDGISHARAHIPSEYGIHLIKAFALIAEVYFVLVADEAHAKTCADIGREGATIVEIPVGIEEQGLEVPLALEFEAGGILVVPARRGVGADGVFNLSTHRHLILGIEVKPDEGTAADRILGIGANIKIVRVASLGHRPRALDGVDEFKPHVKAITSGRRGCSQGQNESQDKKCFSEHEYSLNEMIAKDIKIYDKCWYVKVEANQNF